MAKSSAPHPRIDAKTFERMLLDINVPDEALRPYVVESATETGAFGPVVQANSANVVAPLTEAAVLLGSLNGVARWRRQQRYRRKVADWAGIRIVSEGDSWFQYPLLLTDVIDWLSEPYAILSLDAAGDLLSDMVRQGELVTAVVQEKPHAVLLSGGGNDLLGGSRLSTALMPFEPGRPAEAYLGNAFENNLKAVLGDYEQLFSRLSQVAPQTPILAHVYDHAIPANGRWLGRPLSEIGITDPALQRGIVTVIVDRFHAALAELASQYAHVRVVDTRGAVRDDRWHDELHPTDGGYRSVAHLFGLAIAEATGTEPPNLVSEAAVESGPLFDSRDEAELALLLLDQHQEHAFLREIGRREALAKAGDPLAEEPLAVYPSSLEAFYPDLPVLGQNAVAMASQVAIGAFCDPGGQARSVLAGALHAGRAAVVRHLASVLSGQAMPVSARALMMAAVLTRRVDGLDVDAMCQGWAAMGESTAIPD